MRVDDLLDGGDADGLGDGNTGHGAAGGPLALADDIGHGEGGQSAVVAGEVAAEVGGVAVDHRAGGLEGVDLPHGLAEDDAQDGVAEEVAEAVVHAAAQQILDEVALQTRPADEVRHVMQLAAEAVVEVGVDDGALLAQLAHDADSGAGVDRALELHIKARVLIAEIVGDVADGGHAGVQGVADVGRGVQRADHVVAHMDGDGHLVRQDLPLVGATIHLAGAGDHAVTVLLGHAHAAVETYAETAELIALGMQRVIDLVEGLGRVVDLGPADVGVGHDLVLSHHLFLVLCLGLDAVGLHEQRLGDHDLGSTLVRLVADRLHIRKILFIKPAVDFQLHNSSSITLFYANSLLYLLRTGHSSAYLRTALSCTAVFLFIECWPSSGPWPSPRRNRAGDPPRRTHSRGRYAHSARVG